jgi:hypothetical protein
MAEGIDRWAATAARAAHPSQPRSGPDGDLGDAGRDLGWLWAVVSGLASVTSPWSADDGRLGTAQAHETLIWTPAYEVVLQHWPAGQPGDLHDHGLSHGAFCVVDGEIDEVVVDREGTRVHRHGEGQGSVFRAGSLHRMANAGEGIAVTVNVYAPPLHEVTSYAATDDGSLTVLGTRPTGGRGDDGEGCPPAAPGAAET